MLKIDPQFDHVLIKQQELIKTSESGIQIITSANKDDSGNTYRGSVIAVGPGSVRPDGQWEDMVYTVGDQVIYQQHWARNFWLPDGEFAILPQRRILAKCSE